MRLAMARVEEPSNPFAPNSRSAASSRRSRMSSRTDRARRALRASCFMRRPPLAYYRVIIDRGGIVQLLPLAAEPFVAPTDRDMLPSERRKFVRTHRTCVFGYARRTDGPSMSIVYYIPTGDDELLISTMAGRAKAKAAARNGKVSLCILDERWPFAYVQVYCDARIDAAPGLVVDVMMA